MKKTKKNGFNTPFQDLASRLKQVPRVSKTINSDPPEKAEKDVHPHTGVVNDSAVFLSAMADVTPLSRDKFTNVSASVPKTRQTQISDEHEIINKLVKLVDEGEGYSVSATPEYIEGTGYNVHPEISKRLHRGKFSIQAHLDLHGMTVSEAWTAFDAFLKSSISRGHRALLVIHGRGLSSPGKPVLKPKVLEWLTQGPWKKWVIAFSSAKPADGGTGATYILLRKSPVPKRFRKKQKIF